MGKLGQERLAGTSRQKLNQETMEECCSLESWFSWLAWPAFLYNLPRGVITHSRMFPIHMPTGQADEGSLSTQAFLALVTRLFQADKNSPV